MNSPLVPTKRSVSFQSSSYNKLEAIWNEDERCVGANSSIHPLTIAIIYILKITMKWDEMGRNATYENQPLIAKYLFFTS